MAFPFEQPGMLTPPNQRRPMPGQRPPMPGRPPAGMQRPPMPGQPFAGPGMLAPQGQPGAMGMPPSGVPGQPNPLAAQQQQMGMPGMLAQAMPPGMEFAQMFGQGGPQGPQGPQNPFAAATPEEAARERFDANRRAGSPLTSSGLFQPASPGQGASAAGAPTAQPGTGNVFAGGQQWFPGLFNTTNKTSPFDTFYVDRRRSDTML